MKWLTIIFAGLLVLLQYELWIAPGGIAEAWNLHRALVVMQTKNAKLASRNDVLTADVNDLKHGFEAIEEHARNDLGMVQPNEVFYQVVQ